MKFPSLNGAHVLHQKWLQGERLLSGPHFPTDFHSKVSNVFFWRKKIIGHLDLISTPTPSFIKV